MVMSYNHKNNVCFRKLERQDLRMLKELKGDSWATTHRTVFVTDEDQNRWFDSIPLNAIHLIAYLRDVSGEDSIAQLKKSGSNHGSMTGSGESHEAIGLLSITCIDHISRTAVIGGSIFKNQRGTSWSRKAWEAGTDFAFEMYNLHRVEGEVLEHNFAAMRLDLDIGYVIEGRKRQAVFKCGYYADSFVVGMLRQEWMNTPRVVAYGGICNKDFKVREHSSQILERMGIKVSDEPGEPLVVRVAPTVDHNSVAEGNYVYDPTSNFEEETCKVALKKSKAVPFKDTDVRAARNQPKALVFKQPKASSAGKVARK